MVHQPPLQGAPLLQCSHRTEMFIISSLSLPWCSSVPLWHTLLLVLKSRASTSLCILLMELQRALRLPLSATQVPSAPPQRIHLPALPQNHRTHQLCHIPVDLFKYFNIFLILWSSEYKMQDETASMLNTVGVSPVFASWLCCV